MAEYGNTGAYTNVYEYGVQRTSMYQNGQVYSYEYDGRGSVSELVNAIGKTQIKCSYGISRSICVDRSSKPYLCASLVGNSMVMKTNLLPNQESYIQTVLNSCDKAFFIAFVSKFV